MKNLIWVHSGFLFLWKILFFYRKKDLQKDF